MLGNQDVRIQISRRTQAMPYRHRNADSDLTHFVHRGSGETRTDFGRLLHEPGDHIVLPRGTAPRIFPRDKEGFLLVIASAEMLEMPPADRMRQHSPSDRAVLRLPELPMPGTAPNGDGEWEMVIEREGGVDQGLCPLRSAGHRGMEGRPERSCPQCQGHQAGHGRQVSPASIGACHPANFRARPVHVRAQAGGGHRRPGRGEVAVPPSRHRLRRGPLLPRRDLDEPGGNRRGHDDPACPGHPPRSPAQGDRAGPQGTKPHHAEVAVMIDALRPLHPRRRLPPRRAWSMRSLGYRVLTTPEAI